LGWAGSAPAGRRGAETLLRDNHADARILLAEDHPVNQEIGAALLKTAGLSVEAETLYTTLLRWLQRATVG
jgi:CheY-like chemotaxis protein